MKQVFTYTLKLPIFYMCLIVLVNDINAQLVIPVAMDRNYNLVRVFDSVATFIDEDNYLLQYDLKQQKVKTQFNASVIKTKKMFELFFKDNSKMFEQTVKAYNQNNMKMDRSRIVSYAFDNNNDAYALIRTNYAVPQSSNPDNVDYTIHYFFLIVHIKADTVYNYYTINNTVLPGDYEVVDFGNFIKTNNGFVFTLFNMNAESLYFLAEFVLNNGNAEFSGNMLKPTFPQFHKALGLGYDLLDFRHRDDKIMLHTSNSLLDLNTGNEIVLAVKDIDKAKFKKPMMYGQTFDVPFVSSDFYIDKTVIKFVYTLNKLIYVNVYDPLSNKLISSTQLSAYKLDELQRSPLFDQHGNLVVQLKDKLTLHHLPN